MAVKKMKKVTKTVKKAAETGPSVDASAELAQALLRCAGTGIYIVQGGKFKYVNPLFQEMTGYTLNALKGMRSLDLVHPDDRKAVRTKAIASLKGARHDSYAYRCIKKDGNIIWVMEKLAPIEYKGKRAAVGSFMDITESKKATEDLARSEGRYRTIMDETHDDYFEVDLSGNYTFVNEASCRSTGYTREEMIGKGHSLTTNSEDVKKVYEAFHKMYVTGQPINGLIYRFTRKDGSHGIGEMKALPMRDEKGAIVGFRGVSHDVTERMQMEKALRHSEERYRTMLEDMEEAYSEVDLAGNFTFFNNALCQHLGYSREELLGMNYKVYTSPKAVEKVFAAYNQVYRTGEPIELFAIEEVKKNGTIMVAEISVVPRKNEAGEVIGFKQVSRELTERIRMEEALRQSEARYRTIMDETSDDYFELDLKGDYTFVNDAMCRSSGYTAREMIGNSYKLAISDEDVNKLYEAFRQIYVTGKPVKDLHYKFVRKNGSMGVGEMVAFPMRNENGEIVGFRGVSHDVTQRVMMEEALRQSEEKYRTILAEIEEAYYEVNLAGDVTFVNRGACRQFERSEDKLIGLNYQDFMPKEEIKRVYKTWNKIFRTGESLPVFPFSMVKSNGKKIYVEASISPLRNNEGHTIGFRVVSRDVTERKQFEEKLQDMATHDPLTGLPNRNLLQDRLSMGLALSRRTGTRLAVMMLDLDKFKVINDTMGHGVGDQLLISVADRLGALVRRSDTIARFGGDEFVLVLPQIAQPPDANMLASRIVKAFKEPFVFGEHKLKVTTSVGIAIYPEDGKDAEDLLKLADTAMYWAKEQGRDAYRFYNADEDKAYDKAHIIA